jgi:hypothetical protein
MSLSPRCGRVGNAVKPDNCKGTVQATFVPILAYKSFFKVKFHTTRAFGYVRQFGLGTVEFGNGSEPFCVKGKLNPNVV